MPMRLLCETALLFTLIHTGWMQQTTAVIEGAPSCTGLFLHNFNSKHVVLPLQVFFFFLRGVSFSPYLFLSLLPPFEHSSESRPLTFWSCIKEEMGEKALSILRFVRLKYKRMEMRATETQDRGLDCFPHSLTLNGRARNPGFWLRHPASWSSQEPYSSNPCFCAINPWVNQILLDRQTCSFYPEDVRSLILTPSDQYHLSCELTDLTRFLWQESERVAEGLLVIKSAPQACMKECSCLCLERVSNWEKEGDPGEVNEIWLPLFLLTLRWPCCDISRDLWGLSQVIPNPQSLIQERVCLDFVIVAPKVTIWAFAADPISELCWADLDNISTLCARLYLFCIVVMLYGVSMVIILQVLHSA